MAAVTLSGEGSERGLLLVLSGGKPNDVDVYAGRLFGPAGTVLRRPDQLPEVLVEALRRLLRPRA